MKRNRFLIVRIALLIIAFATLIGLAPSSVEGKSLPNVESIESSLVGYISSKVKEYEELQQKADQDGSVRVIIQLNVPFTPEGELSVPSVQGQRNGIAQVQEAVATRLESFSAKVLRQYKYVPLMVVIVDSAGLADLAANPDVAGIQEDIPVPTTLSESVPLIGADQAWSQGYSGSGHAVAILDTGVDGSHSFLTGKVVAEACFSTTDGDYGSTTICPNDLEQQVGTGAGANCPSEVDGCYHGTHVAGIAAGSGGSFSGVAKDADIIAVQVFSRFDNDTYCGVGGSPCALSFTSDQISALEWVYEQRTSFTIASANMSLGGGQYFSNCDGDSRKPYIDTLRSIGIATVISSGNSYYRDSMGAPACISSAISVGSTTKADVVSSFSNIASFISLLAPGSSIYSSMPGESYAYLNGTSMAAPHVAGAWAVMKSKDPNATVDEVLTALQDTGVLIDDTRSSGSVTDMPRIQVDVAIQSLGATPTPTPHAPADFDGDGDTDITVYHWEPAYGQQWYIKDQGTNSWGAETNIPVPADYDGDGDTDIAVYDNGTWYIKDIGVYGWGGPDSVPVPGDYDGDGDADIAVIDFHPSWGLLWYIKDQPTHSWGNADSLPVQADYDGDGLTDVAVYNDGTWYIEGIGVYGWGNAASIPVPGDYDGDGDADLAVYVLESGTGVWYIQGQPTAWWGGTDSIPVPGDYNGDGITDIAVFNLGTWYVKDMLTETWGGAGDYPIPAPDLDGDGDPY